MGFFRKLIDSEYKELKRFEKIANQIDALSEEMEALSDEELKAKTAEFKEQLENGADLEDLVVPAFAVVREAAYRVIGEKPYFVQILGGLAIHYGNIAEMKTGEGKTLTETMPTYLNALTGKGVHIITVNEFLAKRDSEWMGNIFRFLGLTVGLNMREMSPSQKREAYNCDVLYSTNNEVGFDYLRDNMVVRAKDRVQRPLNFCIVDEVDSILIDEARTPLIISGGKFDSKDLYTSTDRAVKKLKEDDYTVDEKTKSVSLTESGVEKVEKTFHVKNLYDIENAVLVHHLNQSLKAIVNKIKEIHETGQPILVGTVSVENNEKLSALLKKEGLKHEVLNAKNHEREAEIVAKAGEKGAITIATNMAGRGTDIKLGEGVVELGGLCVLGTERHESRRIDNQLRGRAGRQGDPGYSQFFISFEDELMRRFGADKVKDLIQRTGYPEDQDITNKFLSKQIEGAQKKVEGNNYDMRKNLLDYDNIVSEQRKIIYERRNELIDSENIHEISIDTIRDFIDGLVDDHIAPEGYLTDKDYEDIVNHVNSKMLRNKNITVEDVKSKTEEEVANKISDLIIEELDNKVKDVPIEVINDFERHISLRVIDQAWVKHISSMEHLREGIGLRGYAQTNPLQAYAMEGYQIFDAMQDSIDEQIANFMLHMQITQNVEPKQQKPIMTNDGKEHLKAKPKKNDSKIGRNDPCPCGSGKKYKQCCGK